MVTGSFLSVFVILADDAHKTGLDQILIASALKRALISTLNICDGSEDAGRFSDRPRGSAHPRLAPGCNTRSAEPLNAGLCELERRMQIGLYKRPFMANIHASIVS
jgi:hypothetical protein